MKKILSILLIVALIVSISICAVACNKDSSESTDDSARVRLDESTTVADLQQVVKNKNFTLSIYMTYDYDPEEMGIDYDNDGLYVCYYILKYEGDKKSFDYIFNGLGYRFYEYVNNDVAYYLTYINTGYDSETESYVPNANGEFKLEDAEKVEAKYADYLFMISPEDLFEDGMQLANGKITTEEGEEYDVDYTDGNLYFSYDNEEEGCKYEFTLSDIGTTTVEISDEVKSHENDTDWCSHLTIDGVSYSRRYERDQNNKRVYLDQYEATISISDDKEDVKVMSAIEQLNGMYITKVQCYNYASAEKQSEYTINLAFTEEGKYPDNDDITVEIYLSNIGDVVVNYAE